MGGVTKNTYYSDDLYGVLLKVAKEEYPDEKDGVTKIIKDAVKEKAVKLARKHHINVPKEVSEEGEKA